jgi:arylsulfatase A-like enzyme
MGRTVDTGQVLRERVADRWRVLVAPLAWVLCLIAIVWVTDFFRVTLTTDDPVAERLAAGFVSLGHMLQWGGLIGGLFTCLAAVPVLMGRMQNARPAPWVVLAVGLLPSLGWATLWAWPAPSTTSARPDVFLIVVDTMRSDAFDAERTPHLWALGEDGIRFDDALATSSWTLPSFGSFLTGRHPREHELGLRDGRGASTGVLRSDVKTLAEHLDEAGYQTSGLVANQMLWSELGLPRGFSHYRNLLASTTTTWMTWNLGQDSTYAVASLQLQRARWWLNAGAEPGRPQFMMLHFMDPHEPLRPRRALVRAEREVMGDGASVGAVDYGAEVRAVDVAVGRFLELLRATGRYESALIVFCSDHGEELDEARDVQPDRPRPSHGHSLLPELVRVPLAIKLPGGVGAGTVNRELVSLLDLPDTMLEILGMPPLPGSRGVPLLDATGRQLPTRGITFQGVPLFGPPLEAMRDPGHGVIWNPEDDQWRAFDRQADPLFLEPLDRPPEGAQERLRAHVAEVSSAPRDENRTQPELSEEQRRQLEALGYVEQR